MKKLLIALIAAVFASGAFAQSFPDIPEGHWAGDAVMDIAELGIVIGFPDGTFRGNEAFTRYQSALVISRLLDVVNENMDAAMAMTNEDIASIRNAVQELAADVAAQGVRISAAEGAVAGLSDDSAATAARLDELEAMIEGMDMTPEVDPAVIRDLQNQIASQRVAIDTAQATADAAAGDAAQAQATASAAQAAADEAQAAADAAQATADAASGDAGAAQAAADEAQAAADAAQATADAASGDAGAAQAAADAAMAAADAAQGTADAASSDAAEAQARANAATSSAAANAAEVAALNELIQILSGQIDALEADMGAMDMGPDAATVDAVAALEGDIANIREFVILLRRDQVAIRDSVSALEASDEMQSADIADLQDRVAALEANPLDLSGSISVNYFVGRADGVGDTFDIDRAYGLNAMRDIGTSTFSTGAEDLNDDDDATDVGEVAQDRADIEYGSDVDATLSLSFAGGTTFDGEGSPRGLNSFSAVFEVELEELEAVGGETFWSLVPGDFTTTFDPIGAAPLTFAFGEEVTGTFTPYTLGREAGGFVASVGAPDMLAFLDPALWVTYLTTDVDGAVAGQNVSTGIRGTLSPLDGVTGGFSISRHATNTGDKGDVADDNVNDLIWGLDAQASLELGAIGVDLAAEYANGNGSDGAYTDSVLFVTADTMLDVLGGVELGANYRDIALGWDAAFGGGALLDEDAYPFMEDQVGFGVDAGLSLFIFDIGAYFDSYTVDAGEATTAYGVMASAELFRAFSLSANFDQVSIDGTLVDDNGATERDDEYTTGFGVDVAHDGSADNALVPMLNIAAGYAQTGEDYSAVEFYANADYTLSISIVTATPYVSYEQNFDSVDSVDAVAEFAVGTGLMTDPLDVIFQPSLEASANYRQAVHTDAADYTASELQWAVGVNLGEFLLPYSSLSARYGSQTGTNVTVGNLSAGDADTGDTTSSVAGFEVEWNYYDLVFSYGVYNFDPNTSVADDETGAQAFEVAYSVDF